MSHSSSITANITDNIHRMEACFHTVYIFGLKLTKNSDIMRKTELNFLKKEDTDKWHRHMKEENISKTIFFTQS